jgi:hypothetical protein
MGYFLEPSADPDVAAAGVNDATTFWAALLAAKGDDPGDDVTPPLPAGGGFSLHRLGFATGQPGP